MTGTESADESAGRADAPIIIVGGGIVGTSIAFHLREEPQVTLVERSTLGSGTTATSIGQFIEYQDAPDAVEADRRRRSRAFYEPLVADETIGFDQIGTLHVASSDRELETIRRLGDALDRVGVTGRIIDPATLAQYGIDPETVRGGLLLPGDGVLDPTEIIQYFATEARDAGVEIQTNTAVTDVQVADGRVTGVETTEGVLDTGTVVNAAGPWAPQLDDMVAISTPLRHTRGPILVLDANETIPLPLTFFGDGYYVRAEGDRQLFAGKFSTSYEAAATLDPDATHRAAAGEQFRLAIAELLSTHLPGFESLDLINSWVGLRTVTPDGRPLVGPTEVDGYIHATGMSGHGITLAPVVGELLANWMTREVMSDLLTSLSPSRYGP